MKTAASDAGRGCILGRFICLNIVDLYLAVRVLITFLGVRFFCGLRKADAPNLTFKTKGTGEESPIDLRSFGYRLADNFGTAVVLSRGTRKTFVEESTKRVPGGQELEAGAGELFPHPYQNSSFVVVDKVRLQAHNRLPTVSFLGFRYPTLELFHLIRVRRCARRTGKTIAQCSPLTTDGAEHNDFQAAEKDCVEVTGGGVRDLPVGWVGLRERASGSYIVRTMWESRVDDAIRGEGEEG